MRIVITLIFIFLGISGFIAMLPVFVDMISYGKGLEGLNCRGTSTYNETIGEKSLVGCLAFGMYIPYLILGSLAVIIVYLFYNKGEQIQEYYG